MFNRSSLAVRLARRVQNAPLWLLRFVELPFVALLGKRRAATPAIIVLALPRSGSTVAYQTICHGLAVNYLSNLWHLLYQLPLVGGWLSSPKALQHLSDFESQHGFISGLAGPAEGLRFWQWWLDCGLTDADCETIPAAKLRRRSGYLRTVISVLARKGHPFATTYLGHALVPDRVHQAFPGAVLVRLKREPVSNALSLLKSIRANGSLWLSVKPQECEGLEAASEHERVAAQVYWINRRMDDASCADSMITIRYENLCKNPDKEIERLLHWCTERGIPVERKFELPEAFPFKNADVDSDPDAIRIRLALDELEQKHGKLKGGE